MDTDARTTSFNMEATDGAGCSASTQTSSGALAWCVHGLCTFQLYFNSLCLRARRACSKFTYQCSLCTFTHTALAGQKTLS